MHVFPDRNGQRPALVILYIRGSAENGRFPISFGLPELRPQLPRRCPIPAGNRLPDRGPKLGYSFLQSIR